MKDTVVMHKSWDDLVFERRNKEYGAHLIRKKYQNHVSRGYPHRDSGCGLVLAAPRIAKLFETPEPVVEAPKKTMVYSELQAPPPIKDTPPPPKFF